MYVMAINCEAHLLLLKIMTSVVQRWWDSVVFDIVEGLGVYHFISLCVNLRSVFRYWL